MDCPSCGALAGPDQRFCAQCGARLEQACSGCGASLPASARYCPSCGQPTTTLDLSADAQGEAERPGSSGPATSLAESTVRIGDDAPLAERRLVSVLFCDLVGFTGASESRDAEQTRELLSAYYELAKERVERRPSAAMLERPGGDRQNAA